MGVIRHPEQRVAVIIDTQNLYHSAKNLYKAKVNFANVLKAAVGERKLIRAIAYVVNTESGEEQPFFEALEKVGIEIRTKDLQIFYGGAKKADWDVGMAIDAVKFAHKVDAVVLATGDGDFIPCVEYVRSLGCQIEAVTFGRSASSGLKAAVDDFIDLDEEPANYLIGHRGLRIHRGGKQHVKHKKPTEQNQTPQPEHQSPEEVAEAKMKPETKKKVEATEQPKKEATETTQKKAKKVTTKKAASKATSKKPAKAAKTPAKKVAKKSRNAKKPKAQIQQVVGTDTDDM